jgi:hypothetical protein
MLLTLYGFEIYMHVHFIIVLCNRMDTKKMCRRDHLKKWVWSPRWVQVTHAEDNCVKNVIVNIIRFACVVFEIVAVKVGCS